MSQVFEVLDKLRSPSAPGALFYLASESCGSADTIPIDNGFILGTSGAPFRRGQMGFVRNNGRICLTDSSLHFWSGEGTVISEDDFDWHLSSISDVSPEQPLFLAAAPNTPASLVVSELDKIAKAKARRVLVMVGSTYRGVLFELVSTSKGKGTRKDKTVPARARP